MAQQYAAKFTLNNYQNNFHRISVANETHPKLSSWHLAENEKNTHLIKQGYQQYCTHNKITLYQIMYWIKTNIIWNMNTTSKSILMTSFAFRSDHDFQITINPLEVDFTYRQSSCHFPCLYYITNHCTKLQRTKNSYLIAPRYEHTCSDNTGNYY